VHPLDVWVPAPIGLLLGPGDVVAESGPLAAYVAYRSHWNPLQKYVDIDDVPELGNRKRVPHKVQRRPIAVIWISVLACHRTPQGFKGVAPLAIWLSSVGPDRGASAHAMGCL
jgi:hypothetical protein